jgi:hypothetical protein
MNLPLLAEHAHGVAGADAWMWAIWAAAFLVSAWAIWAAVRATFRPGETEPDHVKRSILGDDAAPQGPPAPDGGRP